MNSFSIDTLKRMKLLMYIGTPIVGAILTASMYAATKYHDSDMKEHKEIQHVAVQESLGVLSSKVEIQGREQAAHNAKVDVNIEWMKQYLYRGRSAGPPPTNGVAHE